jgi:hypothetical protein
VSRLTEARERLAVLRANVAGIMVEIRNGNIRESDALERELLAYRDDEVELVREIAELEGGDEGSAGDRVPRKPRPLPMQGAGAVPIPIDEPILVSRLSEP